MKQNWTKSVIDILINETAVTDIDIFIQPTKYIKILSYTQKTYVSFRKVEMCTVLWKYKHYYYHILSTQLYSVNIWVMMTDAWYIIQKNVNTLYLYACITKHLLSTVIGKINHVLNYLENCILSLLLKQPD